MVDWSFGVFDVLFWLFALAVAYYVAFVLDIRHFFIRLKDEKNAKIRRRPDETEPLKLEKVKVFDFVHGLYISFMDVLSIMRLLKLPRNLLIN